MLKGVKHMIDLKDNPPFQNEFLEYLKVIKHYSEKTFISYEFDICELYNYFKSKKIDIHNIIIVFIISAFKEFI